MKTIPGTLINARFLPTLTHVRDLERFDGPLLSEFRSESGEPYVYYWCDCDQTANRWLVTRVTERRLVQFRARRLPLYDLLFRHQDALYCVDLDDNGDVVASSMALLSDLPGDYRPDENAYLKKDAAGAFESEGAGNGPRSPHIRHRRR